MKTFTAALALLVLSCAIIRASSLAPPCCNAMTARCLACHADQTVADYCEANPTTEGCKSRDGGLCCYAMTATCLACNRGESVSDYCKMNPSTAGCPPSDNP